MHGDARLRSSYEADSEDQPTVQWFDRSSMKPIRPPSFPPDGISGNRLWRARGWSTED